MSRYTMPNEAEAAYPQQAAPSRVDFDVLVAGVEGDGVITGCLVTAQGTPDMTVAVAAGEVRLGNTYVSASVTAGNVTISTAHATLPRRDLVVINDVGAKAVITGTAATIPLAPNLPAANIALADIYVPAADTDIDANQIYDRRMFVQKAFVRGGGLLYVHSNGALRHEITSGAGYGFTGQFEVGENTLYDHVMSALTFTSTRVDADLTTGDSEIGLGVTVVFDPSGDVTLVREAFDISAIADGANDFAAFNGMAGGFVHQGTGTVTQANGTTGTIFLVDTGTITHGAALWADPGVKSAGTWTNQYGLRVKAQILATNTTGVLIEHATGLDTGLEIQNGDTYAILSTAGLNVFGGALLVAASVLYGLSGNYGMQYDAANTRFEMTTTNGDGAGGDFDLIRIPDAQLTIDANTTWDANVFDDYDDLAIIRRSFSRERDTSQIVVQRPDGKGFVIRTRWEQEMVDLGVFKEYEDGWTGDRGLRPMISLLGGGLNQVASIVYDLESQVAALRQELRGKNG